MFERTGAYIKVATFIHPSPPAMNKSLSHLPDLSFTGHHSIGKNGGPPSNATE